MQRQSIRGMISAVLFFFLRMSRSAVNYWAEFALDIPLGIALLFEGLQYRNISSTDVSLTTLLGLFIFSYLEYAVHRWLFHGSIKAFVEGHRSHHLNPQGYDALPFFLPALVILSLIGIFILLLLMSYAFLLSGAVAFGYVTYGLSHYSIHHIRFRPLLARRWAAKHLIHHRHPERNFGVTTPLWDILLGTQFIMPNQKKI